MANSKNAKILTVPFVKQFNECACGAAALEMIYKYHGFLNAKQEEIFNESDKFDPGDGNLVLKEETLVSDAEKRGFFAKIIQFTFDDLEDGVKTVKSFVDLDIPLIVCQQWDTTSGGNHFRVIVGIDKKFVFFNDPYLDNAGKGLSWRHEKFFEHWKARGKMVLGNTCTVVTKKGAKLPRDVEKIIRQFEKQQTRPAQL